MALALKRV